MGAGGALALSPIARNVYGEGDGHPIATPTKPYQSPNTRAPSALELVSTP
jgi:hypothetical protein